MVTYHTVIQDSSGWSICADGLLPCLTLYTSFKENEGVRYAATNFIFLFVGLMVCVYSWMTFDVRSKRQKIYSSKGLSLSILVINSWDWKADSKLHAKATKDYTMNEILLTLEETIIGEKAAKRSTAVKRALFFRRLLTLFVSIIVLCLGWGAIMMASIYETEIQNFGSKAHPIIGTLLPTLVITSINYIIPKALEKITEFEKWDFEVTVMKQNIWRTYLA